jgi:hypothetical protein
MTLLLGSLEQYCLSIDSTTSLPLSVIHTSPRRSDSYNSAGAVENSLTKRYQF